MSRPSFRGCRPRSTHRDAEPMEPDPARQQQQQRGWAGGQRNPSAAPGPIGRPRHQDVVGQRIGVPGELRIAQLDGVAPHQRLELIGFRHAGRRRPARAPRGCCA
jgi:hypothetical protein